MSDRTGVRRGAKGYGALSKEDREFLKSYDPKADRKIYGELAIGMYGTADHPGVVDNAAVEGDDVV